MDRVPAYGGSAKVMPNLAKLQNEFHVFEAAHAASSITLQAHMSMLTGLFPITHKVYDPYRAANGASSASFRTLPERMKEKGYKTYFFGGHPDYLKHMLRPEHGFSRGVDEFHSRELFNETDPKFIGERLGGAKAPFFAFIHSWRLHDPFTVPDGLSSFGRRYLEARHYTEEDRYRDYTLNCKGKYSNCMPPDPATRSFIQRIAKPLVDSLGLRLSTFQFSKVNERAAYIEMYDQAVHYVDHLVGKLIDILKAEKIWDSTIVIITGDHGESLLEDDVVGHSLATDEISTVPLLIRVPPSCGKNIGKPKSGPTSTLDITPTILGLIGRPGEGKEFDGLDLYRDKNRKSRSTFFLSRASWGNSLSPGYAASLRQGHSRVTFYPGFPPKGVDNDLDRGNLVRVVTFANGARFPDVQPLGVPAIFQKFGVPVPKTLFGLDLGSLRGWFSVGPNVDGAGIFGDGVSVVLEVFKSVDLEVAKQVVERQSSAFRQDDPYAAAEAYGARGRESVFSRSDFNSANLTVASGLNRKSKVERMYFSTLCGDKLVTAQIFLDPKLFPPASRGGRIRELGGLFCRAKSPGN